MEVAGRNGTFLTLLNQETSLSKFRSIEGKHKVSKPLGIQDKKKPFKEASVFFNTDLFLRTCFHRLQRVKNQNYETKKFHCTI
jgi:hypothetical protein